ncbi:hypothetical protein FRC05_003886 [Tulasnella sp. 425]|nr:hypothetical protein FRC05_003886 [Tulasnella sp. 425]
MRGETCVAIATFFSFVSVILLIFAHVSQINTAAVPKKLHLVQVNVTNYGVALNAATGVTSPGLYTDNASVPLAHELGLRNIYSWGLYGYCAYINDTAGQCGNSTFANGFRPMDVLLSDTPEAYSIQTRTLVPNATAFKNSSYLAGLTKPAFWLIFVATLCAAGALFIGIVKNKWTFIISSFLSIVGTIFLLIGASIYTAAIDKAKTVNQAVVRGSVPLGIEVSAGSGLYLIWAAFVTLLLSTAPYTISCWAFLKR